MKRLLMILFLMECLGTLASNVRITEAPNYDSENLKFNNIANVYLEIEWDNSWRDSYNWDAVYIFLKYKKPTDVAWSHVLLQDGQHVLGKGYTYFPAKNPAGAANKTSGLFVYRDAIGSGTSKVRIELHWMYNMNGLTRQDLVSGISLEASAIEMVYIPKGPFAPGDQAAKNSFMKPYRQILPEWDLINPDTKIYAGAWANSDPATFNPLLDDNGPGKVMDRYNYPYRTSDIGGGHSSYWISPTPGQGGTISSITFDLGSRKTVRYIGIETFNKPVTWKLLGRNTMGQGASNTLMTKTGNELSVNSNQTYPVTRAIKVDNPGSYRYYTIEFDMGSQAPVWVSSISMTDVDIETVTEDAYVIDGAGNTVVFNATRGLNVKNGNLSGSLDANYAAGFEGFYAMKYEVSQQQYADFLNKLLLEEQQKRTIGEALLNLEIGDYVYGDNRQSPSHRNGIILGARQDNRYTFTCNLNPSNAFNSADDGQSIACNYLSPADMLAYAAWTGLRPLSELEYEKMAHQSIDSATAVVPTFPNKAYAWGSTDAVFPASGTVANAGRSTEKLSGAYLNATEKVSGPVRSGSFATGAKTQAESGGSFYGVMELSGNLAEIYYRSEPGKILLSQVLAAHGSGTLTTGDMPSNLNSYWGNPAAADWGNSLILRGGSYASIAERTWHADRGETNGFGGDINRKDETVTFRLGHSVTAYQTAGDMNYYPLANLTNENGAVASAGVTVYDTVCSGYSDFTYRIRGNDPVAEGMIPSGQIRYAWYSMTDGGIWTLMPGRNTKDLILRQEDLDHSTITYRNYSFKRRMYTPTQYSETGTVVLRVGMNRPFSRDKEEILKASNQISGVLVESTPKATFAWTKTFGGRTTNLPAFYTTEYSSYMSVLRDSFPTAGKGTLSCVVTTKELGCKATVTLPITVEARPTTGIASDAMTLANCGQPVKDARDNQIYTTVKIGSQCWMAENMRYGGSGVQTAYDRPEVPYNTYGKKYYANESHINNICPNGWVVPSNNDFTALVAYADESDYYGGYRLRAGNFWTMARDNAALYNNYIYSKHWNVGNNPTGMEVPFNSLGFGLMGGGWQNDDPRVPSNNHAALLSRDCGTWKCIWRLIYSNENFYHWSSGYSYYVPVRCILKTTSVD